MANVIANYRTRLRSGRSASGGVRLGGVYIASAGSNYFVPGTGGFRLGGFAPPSVTSTQAGPTYYTLMGPSTIGTGVGYGYTVVLGTGYVSTPIRVTFSDGAAGGSFTPPYVDMTNATRSQSVSYAIGSEASLTISTTNDGGLSQTPTGGLAVNSVNGYGQGGSGFGMLF